MAGPTHSRQELPHELEVREYVEQARQSRQLQEQLEHLKPLICGTRAVRYDVDLPIEEPCDTKLVLNDALPKDQATENPV